MDFLDKLILTDITMNSNAWQNLAGNMQSLEKN